MRTATSGELSSALETRTTVPRRTSTSGQIVIRRERHLDVERIACPWHVFRTIRWHPTNQDAGAADVFYDLHVPPDRCHPK